MSIKSPNENAKIYDFTSYAKKPPVKIDPPRTALSASFEFLKGLKDKFAKLARPQIYVFEAEKLDNFIGYDFFSKKKFSPDTTILAHYIEQDPCLNDCAKPGETVQWLVTSDEAKRNLKFCFSTLQGNGYMLEMTRRDDRTYQVNQFYQLRNTLSFDHYPIHDASLYDFLGKIVPAVNRMGEQSRTLKSNPTILTIKFPENKSRDHLRLV